MEDFAQILDLYPTHENKYKKANYETLGKILWRLHPQSLSEFVRRLVFIILSANGDAHIKNWSLWYPDRVRAELAPAYDLVSTVEFIANDELALRIDGVRAWSDLSLARFAAFARRIGIDPGPVVADAEEAVHRTLDAWSQVRSDASPILRERLEAHWERVPLVRDVVARPH